MKRIRWVATFDGVAHAHRSARVTACGVDRIRERDARPTLTRCPACIASLERER